MMYLQTILNRSDEEITKKGYSAQKKNPLEGDWMKLVEHDFQTLGLEIDENEIRNCTKSQYKVKVKTILREHMFHELKKEQSEHSKISTIKYPTYEMQGYLKTHMMNNQEVSLLFGLRSKTVKDFKANFPFHSDKKCLVCGKEDDTQDHFNKCEITYPLDTRDFDIMNSEIYSDDISKPAAVTKLFSTLLQRREDASTSTTGPSSCPGTTVV